MQPLNVDESPQRWSWWKDARIQLALGVVGVLALWVGLGLWLDRQIILAHSHFENHQHHAIGFANAARLHPRWIPKWMDSWLPPMRSLCIPIVHRVEFNGPVEKLDVEALARLPEVTSIVLTDTCEISGEMLTEVIRNRPLAELSFDKPQSLSTGHLELLVDSRQLQFLGIIAGPFDEESLKKLGSIRGLENLRLDGRAEGVQGIVAFAKLPSLKQLVWTHSELDDEQFAALSTNGNLKLLHLTKTRLTEKSWSLLEKMNVWDLTLESPNVSTSLARSIARMPEMWFLELKGGTIGDDGVLELTNLQLLKRLLLTSKGLTSASAKYLSQIKSLRVLTVYDGANVDDDWIAELAQSKLGSLRVINSQVTDKGLKKLRGNSSLYELSLPGSRITDESIDAFNSIPELSILDLRNTAITDDGIRRLNLKTGNAVLVGGTQVTLEGAREFLSRNPGAQLKGVDGQPIPRRWDVFDLSAESEE